MAVFLRRVLFIFVGLTPCLAVSAGQAEKPPLLLTLQIQYVNGLFTSTVCLRNTSTRDVVIVEHDTGPYCGDEHDAFRLHVTDPSGDSTRRGQYVSFRSVADTKRLRTRVLQPGAAYSFHLDDEMYYVGLLQGTHSVVASYDVTDDVLKLCPAAERTTVWRGRLESNVDKVIVETKLSGIGAVAKPAWWIRHKGATLRLVFCGGAAQPPRPSSIPREGRDRGRRPVSEDGGFVEGPPVVPVGSVPVGNTGVVLVLPHRPGADPMAFLRPFGLPEATAEQKTLPKEATWLRELDGAKIRYRLVTDDRFAIVFEAWDEEWDACQDQMNDILRRVKEERPQTRTREAKP